MPFSSSLNFFETFELMIPALPREQKVLALILEAESKARELNGLSANHGGRTPDPVEVLESTCLLLNRLSKQSAWKTETEPAVESGQAVVVSEPLPELGASVVEVPAISEPVVSKTVIPEPIASEPELSETAAELIRLRDWVLMAKSAATPPQPDLLETLYQQLGKVLQKEGVSCIEDSGEFNYEQQQVVATKPTDDSNQVDRICETVRPGYKFYDQLIRPQEVVVYTLQANATSVEDGVA